MAEVRSDTEKRGSKEGGFMCRVSGRVLLTVLALLLAGQTRAGEAAQVAEPFTEQERAAFDGMYAKRVASARGKAAKLALAKELHAAVDGSEGGLKYLLLAQIKGLAKGAGDLEMAVGAAKQLVELKRGDPNALLGELLGLQLRRFDALVARGRKTKDPKEKQALRKSVTVLGGEIVDNAILLGDARRGERAFAEAERAETAALKAATLVSSPKVSRLRQGILISKTLLRAADSGRKLGAAGKATAAVWEYLDAGMDAEAAKLVAESKDETQALLVRVAAEPAAEPKDIFAAAKAWDGRAQDARGALAQIRLMRAAELYERYMPVGDELDLKVAKIRLKAIHQQLGDMLAALRKPAEWIYLVDLKAESVKVGWGSLKKITAAKGPLSIAGTKVPTGLWAHASSRLVYPLAGKYRQFSTFYGLQTGAGGAASFHIICDGKTVFSSPGMWRNHTQGVRKAVVISVVGVEKLELVTKGIHGGAGAFSCWGDPKIR